MINTVHFSINNDILAFCLQGLQKFDVNVEQELEDWAVDRLRLEVTKSLNDKSRES